MSTYAPPDYAANTQRHLQALIAGQKLRDEEYGSFTQIVHTANQKFEEESQYTQKGKKVYQYLCYVVYVHEDHELAAFMGLPDRDTQDNNTRPYLLALQSGVKPDFRPDFGWFEPVVKKIEEHFEETPPHKRVQLMPKIVKSISRLSQFKHLRLEELLAGVTAEQKPGAPPARDQEAIMPPLPEIARLDPELGKHGCWWLDSYVQHSKQVSPEGYEDFHEACGLWVLSTVAAGRIVLPGGDNGQHTALMIALVAKPGERAKSTTAEVGVGVLRAANLRSLLGADETTPQKMLADMSGKYPPPNFFQLPENKQEHWKQRLALAGQRGWYYDELGAFFRAMSKPNGPMSDFRGLLLKLDSRKQDYRYATKIDGEQEINYPYLALLGCTTFADFRTVARVGSDDWNDGMLSRFIPVVPPSGPPPESPFTFETISVPYGLSSALWGMHEWLGIPLIDVVEEDDNKGKGKHLAILQIRERTEREIRPDANVIAAWNAYRKALRTMEKPEDLASSYVRLPVKALRVAALFAGMEKLTTIEIRHWAKAQEIAERWRKSLHELYIQINMASSPTSNTLESKVLAYLEKCPESKARDIYQNLNIDAEVAKKVLFNLVQSGDVTKTANIAKNGRNVDYYSKAGGSGI